MKEAKKQSKPSEQLYTALDSAYRHFNKELFKDKLPEVLFTLQKQPGMFGYFVADRWTSPDGVYCHEIAINPTHMGTSRLFEVLQTLVHEMVHCWQHVYGNKPSKCYHDKQWAYKMMEIGLHPSSTGKPGGAITGVKMSDYIIEDGLFWKSCLKLISQNEYQLPWIYRLKSSSYIAENESDASSNPPPLPLTYSNDSTLKDIKNDSLNGLIIDESLLFTSFQDLMPENTFFSPTRIKKSKSKYSCPKCHLNMWGRPNAKVACLECNLQLQEIGC